MGPNMMNYIVLATYNLNGNNLQLDFDTLNLKHYLGECL